ncbi:glycogen debranching enzyme GlgX [Actinomyces denticolens]|nr:glycogen debranching enzyme GlgX [Actinomyces denticolens]
MSGSVPLAPAPLAPARALERTRLGATPQGDGTDFVVVAPRATAVDLCLIEVDDAGTPVSERRIGMHGPQQGAWDAHVPGVGVGQRYGYRVHGFWNPSEALLHNPRKMLLDPYARLTSGTTTLSPEIYAHTVEDDLSPALIPFAPSGLDSLGSTALGVVTGGPASPWSPAPASPSSAR